jgi:site-specific DNA recombinase
MQVAIYARVSSDQQTEAGTINSQIAALIERAGSDCLQVPDELRFIDDGYSGATLVRPALERLRDVVYGGALDRVYIQSPDRLSRKYAYQILLIDEFRRAGVDLVFLNRKSGETPEDELLLQVQGVVAEYERAKIMERSRRGKLHAAKQGSVSVLAGAPYGYRYIPKRASQDGEAHYEIFFEEARVVQQIFEWIGKERVTLREVCKRLTASGIKTRTGKTWWQPKSILQILKNSAYIGQAAFGKSKYGPKRLRLRPHKGHGEVPRNQYSIYSVPEEEWIRIAVPAIVTSALFETVQEQIVENKSSARVRKDGAKYLLQGLTGCKLCGHAYYAKLCICGKDKSLSYTYYRCVGGDGYRREGGIPACDNKPIRGDLLEKAVWDEVIKILQKPDCLEREYKRRLAAGETHDGLKMESEQKKLRNTIARMIDGYADGIIEKREFEPRIKQARAKLSRIESQLQKAQETADTGRQLRLLIVQLGDFSSNILSRLQSLDFETKRSVIRALVKRIDVDRDSVNVTFRFGDLEMPKTKAG